MRVQTLFAAGCLLATAMGMLLFTAPAQAQSRFGSSRTVGGAVGGLDNRNTGLTQSGQISSSAAIVRDETGFIGASGAANPRSRGGTAGGLGTGGLSPAFGLGTSLGGGLGLGNNLFGGGLGGIGGGFGGGIGGFGGGGFGRNTQMQGQGGAGRQGQMQQPIRAPIRIGFTQATVSSEVVSQRFSQRLEKLPGIRLESPVAVEMEGRTAILRGVVTSENDRDLVGRLALLEPGISEVRNELTVAASEASR
jgi:hypothetical protein